MVLMTLVMELTMTLLLIMAHSWPVRVRRIGLEDGPNRVDPHRGMQDRWPQLTGRPAWGSLMTTTASPLTLCSGLTGERGAA